ncbi:MAG: hypothetical protein N3A67_09840, partial [Ignavibacteria bacterium]|nr:hypothetical protein [Ignavibacteria bacterium]
SIKISKLNIEKYEDNINLFNSIKNAKFDKTTNGIKIKHNQNRNIIIQKNDVCILRNNCTIKFRLTNLTDKAKKIKVYFGYKDESKRQFKIQEYTLTKEQEIIFSIESTTGKNLIKIVISGDIDNLEISNLKIKYNITKRCRLIKIMIFTCGFRMIKRIIKPGNYYVGQNNLELDNVYFKDLTNGVYYI